MSFKDIEEKYAGVSPETAKLILEQFFNYFQLKLLESKVEKLNLEDELPTKVYSKREDLDKEEHTTKIAIAGDSFPYTREEALTIPEEIEKIVAELKMLFKHNLYTEAISYLEKVVSQYPHDIPLQRSLVELLLLYRERDKAVELLFNIVQLYFEQHNIVAMKRTIQEILNLDPTNKRALKLKERFGL